MTATFIAHLRRLECAAEAGRADLRERVRGSAEGVLAEMERETVAGMVGEMVTEEAVNESQARGAKDVQR